MVFLAAPFVFGNADIAVCMREGKEKGRGIVDK